MVKSMLPVVVVATSLMSFGAVAKDVGTPAFKCDPAVMDASAATNPQGRIQFNISCQGALPGQPMPTLQFAGEAPRGGDTGPYRIRATYTVDSSSMKAKVIGQEPMANQLIVGKLSTSVVSMATLATQLTMQTHWDASSNTLSIEERPGSWRIINIQADAQYGNTLSDAGVSKQPIRHGHAHSEIELGKKYSRFAGKGPDHAKVKAKLGLRDGKLEVLLADTREMATKGVQDAIHRLDRAPKDMARAWALASRAKYLGLTDVLKYAEQKVAAWNPNLLQEFQADVQRVPTLTLEQ